MNSIICSILFGIQLRPVFDAIAEVESNSGKRSPNVYQLTRVYVSDINRITGGRWDKVQRTWKDGRFNFTDDDRKNKTKSEKAMVIYWDYYGKIAEEKGVKVTVEVLANIHRYGLKGALEWHATKQESPYWKKVNREYDKRGNK